MEKTETKKKYLLLKLFFSTLYISSFTFGGGFVIVTFMKRKFVDELHWIDEQEMLDLAALAQSSPGADCRKRRYFSGLACVRVCRDADSGAGDHSSAHAHPVRYIILLCSICQQCVCGIGVKGDAGRCCRSDPRCGMRAGEHVFKEKSGLSIGIMAAAFGSYFASLT